MVAELQQLRQADRAELSRRARAVGGPKAYLKRTLPTLTTSRCPTEFAEADLLAQTIAYYEDGSARLRLCKRCPEEGGACAGLEGAIGPGREPCFEDGRLTSRECERWSGWQSRAQLRRYCGVSPRIDSCRFANFGKRAGHGAALQMVLALWERLTNQTVAKHAMQYAALAKSGNWLLLSGAHREAKTHLGVALIANAFESGLGRCRYMNVEDLVPLIKESWSDKEADDPLRFVRDVHVLTLDGLYAPSGKQGWLRDTLGAALRHRREQCRPTLLISQQSAEAIAKGLPAVAGLATVTECKLGK
jgi:DNA replication protein DnaC